MRSFWRIFWLEWMGLVRSRTILLLLAASAFWMLLAPCVLDPGVAPDGSRETVVRYSLGGVAALVAVALTAAATGSVARERAASRLQLTLVRPVRRFAIVLGKIAALASAAALVLATAAAIEAVRAGPTRPCRHAYRPQLPSVAEEARLLYGPFLRDPATPEAERKLPKSVILRILEQRVRENYQPVATNGTAVWAFPSAAFSERPSWIRLRITNDWHLRDDVRLEVRLGGAVATVTNLTQTVTEHPFRAAADGVRSEGTLEIANVGERSIMLRPRRDVEVLVEADGFTANLVRATLELLALVTALVAFGVFLGTALSRPVALFTAFVTLTLSEMSPSVLESSSGTEADGRGDRIALAMTRFTAAATRPVSAFAPLERLATDECVEPREVAVAVAADMILLPGLLSLLATLVLLRKTSDGD